MTVINLLPGPVAMLPAVRVAFAREATSHRAQAFLAQHARVREALCALTGARHATLLMGSGTLANDVVGAQLTRLGTPGVVVSNGEFGERLVDHAMRHGLEFDVVRSPWGEAIDFESLSQTLARRSGQWLWAVHSETSTGVVNDLPGLRAVARRHQARLALDAVSSVGALPVQLDGVWMASAVSGKALASFPGIAIVLHVECPEPDNCISRYLDLGHAVACGSIPFTQSSNAVEALAASLDAHDWSRRITEIARDGYALRERLEACGFHVLAPRAAASPAVHTIVLPVEWSACATGEALREQGWLVSFESDYLRARNWLQLCLFGEYDAETLSVLPVVLRNVLVASPGSVPAAPVG
jgi:aspartate aminotransferase-like enzyme